MYFCSEEVTSRGVRYVTHQINFIYVRHIAFFALLFRSKINNFDFTGIDHGIQKLVLKQ